MLDFLRVFFQPVFTLLGIYILAENKVETKISIILLFIACGGVFLIYPWTGALAAYLTSSIFIIGLFKKTNHLISSIIITCLTILSLVLGDYISDVAIIYLFDDRLGLGVANLYFYMVVIIAHFVITILICFIVRYLLDKYNIYRLFERNYGKLIITFLTLTLIIFYVNVFIGQREGFSPVNVRANTILFLIYSLLLLGVFGILSYIIFKESNMETERVQYQSLQEYIAQIEQLYDNINTFRHDYINILLTLEEGISLKDIEMIKDVYEDTVKPTRELVKSNQYGFFKLRNLQVNEVKSILAAKIINAQAQHIDVNLEIEEEIKTIHMELIDFCRIFSILVDNAIEAAAESEKPNISIAFIQEQQLQRVIIENSCSNQKINLQEIFKKGYSSKGKNRGTGLYSVRQLLNKNRYITLETTYESSIFVQTLIIKKKEG